MNQVKAELKPGTQRCREKTSCRLHFVCCAVGNAFGLNKQNDEPAGTALGLPKTGRLENIEVPLPRSPDILGLARKVSALRTSRVEPSRTGSSPATNDIFEWLNEWNQHKNETSYLWSTIRRTTQNTKQSKRHNTNDNHPSRCRVEVRSYGDT
jgi:hypothetical protein